MSEESKLPEGTEPQAPQAVAPEGVQEGDDEGVPIPHDAFFSPDDPIVRSEGDIPDDAIFSPDDPLTRSDGGEGVVTGMAGTRGQAQGKGRGLAWEIQNTAKLMDTLARELRGQGMEALKLRPETEPMDAMLRSFVAGFLVGRMDEEE